MIYWRLIVLQLISSCPYPKYTLLDKTKRFCFKETKECRDVCKSIIRVVLIFYEEVAMVKTGLSIIEDCSLSTP